MKDELPLVSIIIVNYNGKKYLKDCFDSLFALNYPKDKIEIIMVDNCSSDDSISYTREEYPQVKILKNDINNYARANNLGIKHAQGEYIALLNNDTKVDADWLVGLVKVMLKDETIGAVGSKILFMDGRINSVGHQELPNFYWKDKGFGEKDRGQYDESTEIDGICGGAVLYRQSALRETGYLDEDFNMFLEDVDISMRMKRNGWRIVYVPGGRVLHVYHGTASSELTEFYCERNRLLLIAKYFPQELNRSLWGRGYFTAQRDVRAARGLYRILGDVVLKLTKHHKPEIVKGALEGLFVELGKLPDKEKELHIRNLQLEINKTRQALGDIYDSTAFRYLIRPLWVFLWEVKKTIRSILKLSFKHIFRNNLQVINKLRTIEIRLYQGISNIFKKSIQKKNNSRITNDNKGINVFGYVNAESGLGEGVRSSIRCLKTAGLEFSLVNIPLTYTRQGDISFSDFIYNDNFHVNLIQVTADMLPAHFPEKENDYFKDRYNIGYWSWELSIFPDYWQRSFLYCNEIWAPSTFVLDSISKKSPIPVLRIPHAVEVNRFKDVKRPYFKLKEGEFVFLFIFDFLSYFERKNPLAIIRAFKKEFSPRENIRLVIKCINSSFDPLAMRRMKEAAQGANIDIIDNYLYKDEVNTLVSLSDCYVSLHRSEGFGLTMAEAMFLGKPVIATGYSGNMDFMNNSNSYPVKYKLVSIEQEHGPYKKGFFWAEPDIAHAAELMRYVYENKEAGKERGRIAAADIRNMLSYEAVGKEIKNRIDFICNGHGHYRHP